MQVTVRLQQGLHLCSDMQILNHLHVCVCVRARGGRGGGQVWDLWTPNPVHAVQMPDKVLSMDIGGSLMAVAYGTREVACYNLQVWLVS